MFEGLGFIEKHQHKLHTLTMSLLKVKNGVNEEDINYIKSVF